MSALGQAVEDYLRLRRSLGHDLADAGRLLPRFVAYMDGLGAETITVETAVAWAQQPDAEPGTTVWPRRMTAVRGFARYMAGHDPCTEVPPTGLLAYRQRWRPPFIYTTGDIAALMTQALGSIPSPLRAATYETLVGLLASTGMRVGEAIRLDHADIDWSDGVLLIRESKFGKTRLVPVHGSTLDALVAYTGHRDALQPRPQSPSFFVSNKGTRLCYAVVSETFRNLASAAGVGTGSTVTPRLHDLRHSFAVRTLLGWYRAGEDVRARLPWLSTYLGHRDPRSTYWYLSAAPELLALAAGRLEVATEAVTP
jgi:integrase/recombinase XerD